MKEEDVFLLGQPMRFAQALTGDAEPSASVWDRPRFFDIAREIVAAPTEEIEAMIAKNTHRERI